MYNKTIILLHTVHIRNNQDLSNCYQPRPWARLITLTSNLIIPDISKTSLNNSLFTNINLVHFSSHWHVTVFTHSSGYRDFHDMNIYSLPVIREFWNFLYCDWIPRLGVKLNKIWPLGKKALFAAMRTSAFSPYLSLLSRIFPGLENCFANFQIFPRIQDSVSTLLLS